MAKPAKGARRVVKEPSATGKTRKQPVAKVKSAVQRVAHAAAAVVHHTVPARPAAPAPEAPPRHMAASPQVPPPVAVSRGWHPPAGYGDNRIVLMVRDPWWVYSYWEVQEWKIAEVRRAIGEEAWSSARSILRVYDVTGITFTGANAHGFRDIELSGGAADWYIDVGGPGRSWCVEIGVRCADGRFFVLARSNTVTTPRDTVSPVIDEEWMVQDDDFHKLAGLGALRPGASANISELMRKRLMEQVSSGSISSMSSPQRSVPGYKRP